MEENIYNSRVNPNTRVTFRKTLINDIVNHVMDVSSQLSLVPDYIMKTFYFRFDMILRYYEVQAAAEYLVRTLVLNGHENQMNRQFGNDWQQRIYDEYHTESLCMLNLAKAYPFNSTGWDINSRYYGQMKFVKGLHHYRDLLSVSNGAPSVGARSIIQFYVNQVTPDILGVYIGENKDYLTKLNDKQSKLPIPYFDIRGQGMLVSVRNLLKVVDFPFDHIQDWNAIIIPQPLGDSFCYWSENAKLTSFFTIQCSTLDISSVAFGKLFGICLANTFALPILPFVPGEDIPINAPVQEVNYRYAVSRMYSQWDAKQMQTFYIDLMCNCIFTGFVYNVTVNSGWTGRSDSTQSNQTGPSYTPLTRNTSKGNGNKEIQPQNDISMQSYSGVINDVNNNVGNVKSKVSNAGDSIRKVINISKRLAPLIKIGIDKYKANELKAALTDIKTISENLNNIESKLSSTTVQFGAINTSLNIFSFKGNQSQ